MPDRVTPVEAKEKGIFMRYQRTDRIGGTGEKHLPAFLTMGCFTALMDGPAVEKTIDLKARRKDGTEISVRLTLCSAHLRGRWYAVGILRDIRERRQAAGKLREAISFFAEETALGNEMAAMARLANTAKSALTAAMMGTDLMMGKRKPCGS